MNYFEMMAKGVSCPGFSACGWIIDVPPNHGCRGYPNPELPCKSTWNVEYVGYYPGSEFLHFDLQESLFPIMSERLQRFIIEEFGPIIECFPLRLRQVDGTCEVRGYSIVEAKLVVPCADESDFEIVLDEARLPNTGIFTARGFSNKWIVNNEVRSILTKQRFTGLHFDQLPVCRTTKGRR